jgi:hypothetical protein
VAMSVTSFGTDAGAETGSQHREGRLEIEPMPHVGPESVD